MEKLSEMVKLMTRAFEELGIYWHKNKKKELEQDC